MFEIVLKAVVRKVNMRIEGMKPQLPAGTTEDEGKVDSIISQAMTAAPGQTTVITHRDNAVDTSGPARADTPVSNENGNSAPTRNKISFYSSEKNEAPRSTAQQQPPQVHPDAVRELTRELSVMEVRPKHGFGGARVEIAGQQHVKQEENGAMSPQGSGQQVYATRVTFKENDFETMSEQQLNALMDLRKRELDEIARRNKEELDIMKAAMIKKKRTAFEAQLAEEMDAY